MGKLDYARPDQRWPDAEHLRFSDEEVIKRIPYLDARLSTGR